MTAENLGFVERIFVRLLEGDRPFMGLFIIIMFFMIFIAIKAMGYVRSLSEGHKEEITALGQNHKEQLTFMNESFTQQRKEHYEQLTEDRARAEKREDSLFVNMDRNTEQLTDIASTLKEVQFNFANLEKQVTENFDFLSSEIENVKSHVTVKTTTHIHQANDPES